MHESKAPGWRLIAIVAIPWLIVAILALTNLSKTKDQEVELFKRGRWITETQNFILRATEERYGQAEMKDWQSEFCKANGLKPVEVPKRPPVAVPVLLDGDYR